MLHHFASILALACVTSAHFILDWPPTAGFDDDTETTSPCGGATVSVNSSSPQINVGQFAVEIQVAHPTGSFSFFATTDTVAPYNFTQISEDINSTNIGFFCANYLSAPSSFAGQAGVLQVIDNSVDGVLYQCAAVNFVSGSNTTVGSTCTNSSGVSLTWSGDATVASASTSAATTTTTTTTSSHAGAAAMATMATMAVAPILGGLVAGFLL